MATKKELREKIDIDDANIGQVMTKSFKTIECNLLVADAAKFMQKNKIYNLVVKENTKVVGFNDASNTRIKCTIESF